MDITSFLLTRNALMLLRKGENAQYIITKRKKRYSRLTQRLSSYLKVNIPLKYAILGLKALTLKKLNRIEESNRVSEEMFQLQREEYVKIRR